MDKDIIRRVRIDEAALPRVLIIGQTFTTDTGGGITLTSLFKNWPKDKLAVAVESKEGIDFTKAAHYYRIGYQELKMPFPFYYFQRKTKSGLIDMGGASGAVKVAETGALKFRLKNYFDSVLHAAGLYFWVYGNQKISDSLIDWVKDFKPEFVYYQPNSYKSIGFVQSLYDKVRVPLVIHVMDDWFSFAVRPGPLKKYWQHTLDRKVNMLFAQASIHLSICNYMSAEYERKYGYKFIPFHNSVSMDFWSAPRNVKNNLNSPARILYAGRIGDGVSSILLKIANVVERMGDSGIPVCLEIQTKDMRHKLVNTLSGYRHIFFSGPIPYQKLPEKFSAADILLIPCDVDGPGLKFIKYSMPTKVSEYMATGTPILVVGPPDTALVEYANEGWAEVCLSDRDSAIESSICNLISSESLRGKITARARLLAAQNHDEKLIISRFRDVIMNCSTVTTDNKC